MIRRGGVGVGRLSGGARSEQGETRGDRGHGGSGLAERGQAALRADVIWQAGACPSEVGGECGRKRAAARPGFRRLEESPRQPRFLPIPARRLARSPLGGVVLAAKATMPRGECGGASIRRSRARPGAGASAGLRQPSEGSLLMGPGQGRGRGLCFLLLALVALVCPERGTPVSGGWELRGHLALEEEEKCTVDRRANLTYAEFIHQYAFSKPVILQRLTNNTLFQDLCSKDKLLAEFGDFRIRLSTANTYSYQKVDLSFQDYVEQLLQPQDPNSLGNDTLYFFGDNNFTEWGRLFQHYSPPPFRLLGTTAAYSFGIAGAGSGVPFHWHGPGYSEVIFGRKRWFLYPPEKIPDFHPNKTTLAWLRDTYPALPITERPLQCTVQAGEVLYFPDRWWHATLNLDTSVFISTFLG